MSQTSQTQTSKPPGQGRPGQGRPGQGRPRRERKPVEEKVWIPQTNLGKEVVSGEINSMEEILSNGLRIQEAGIVKKLLPDLKTEVIDVGIIPVSYTHLTLPTICSV